MKTNIKTRLSFQRGGKMEIRRDRYLQQIIDYMWDGQVKVITGILLISVCSVSNHAADDAEPICPKA